MRPNEDPPGTWCAGCRALIDANEDAVGDATGWWCSDDCRRLSRLAEAEQLVIGGNAR